MPFPSELLENIKTKERIYFPSQLTPLTDNDVKILVENALKKTTSIKSIFLPDNELTDQTISELAKLPHLTMLNLSDNEITSKGIAHIANHFPQLEYLSLCELPITNSDTQRLLEHPSISTLHLDGTLVDDEIVSRILANKNLVYISLAFTKISEGNKSRIKEHTEKNASEKAAVNPPSPGSKENFPQSASSTSTKKPETPRDLKQPPPKPPVLAK